MPGSAMNQASHNGHLLLSYALKLLKFHVFRPVMMIPLCDADRFIAMGPPCRLVGARTAHRL